MRYFARKKILYFILLLVCVSIIGLTVAYALLSTTLNISGTADVVAASWNIYFEEASFVEDLSTNFYSNATVKKLNYDNSDYRVDETYFTTTNSSGDSMVIDGSFLSFRGKLEQPGDYIAISFMVVNGGSIDGELSTEPMMSGLSSELDLYVDWYVKYSDGTIPKPGDILAVDEEKELLFVIEYDKDINKDDLPTEDLQLNLTFSMNYIQAD